MKVFYCAEVNKDGVVVVTVTDDEYWNEHDCFDGYGESDHYESINDVMVGCGAENINEDWEWCKTKYLLHNGVTIEDVAKAMSENGFELVNDPDFEKFCSEASIVYYHSYKSEDADEGELNVVVTAKNYWENNQCVDDGSALGYIICGAMEYCGAEEACEAEYVLYDGLTIKKLIKEMSKIGFTMIADPGFAAFLDSCDS